MLAHRRVHVAALAALLALLGIASTGAARAPTPPARTAAVTPTSSLAATLTGGTAHYVALGDSFAAGPFIPVQRTDPIGCARSTRNYPALLAERLGIRDYVDVTCSGAGTVDMTAAQRVPLGTNVPQFDALRAETDLVTVSIGGNDIGYSGIVLTCSWVSASDPLGDPCRRQVTAGGSDVYADRITAAAPKVAKVLQGIRERSPHAVVLVVGYLRILPPAVGCWPVVPIAHGDVPYLDGIQQQLTTMMATQARENGAWFIDAYAHSLGHDSCQAPLAKWVEGILPTSPAYPVHPNEYGMRAVADLTLDVLTNTPS
jgi:lysophospholipase L1-like esterase